MSERKTAGPGMDDRSQKRASRHPVNLLLVDDEKAYVNVLANRLSRRGMVVTKAYSGSEGIQCLRKHDFDVAVLDVKMEDMDGIDVLKIFKKMDPDIAVVMLTGHGSETAARQGLEYGAFDYATKPCELPELLEIIQSAYQSRQRYRLEKE